MRSAELTLPGFTHDVCSTIHALAAASPMFSPLPLAAHGLEWIRPSAPLAHPLDDGTAVLLERSPAATGDQLGPDARVYERLIQPFVAGWDHLAADLLGPWRWPAHPFLAARFGALGLRPASSLLTSAFAGPRARALFAGLASHAIMPLEHALTSAFGLLLAVLGHVTGWPIARGGSQRLADALAAHLTDLGGTIRTGAPVTTLNELPPCRAILCDVTPRQLLSLAGSRLPARYQRSLQRYRYGPGVFKIDWALHQPIPWTASACARAATVHVGGGWEEIAAAEREVWAGRHPQRPFVLLAQPSLFDATRAPAGHHTAWAYCHVPNGSTVDMARRIEAQVERFAPGFQEVIMARSTRSTAQLEAYNANYVGGDINGGVQDWRQLWTRPVARRVPYATPVRGLYLCSSSTPPGGGVHGLCGYHAARAALNALFIG